jgi:hypothetical protein
LKGWARFYLVGPLAAASGFFGPLAVYETGIPDGYALPVLLGLPVLLLIFPYKNLLHALGTVLTVGGGCWLLVVVLSNDWTAAGVAVGVLAFVVGLCLFVAGLIRSRDENA